MLGDTLAYVALVVRDTGAAINLFEKHLELTRADMDAGGDKIPVFGIGASSLAVFPLGHPYLDGFDKPGVHHIALAAKGHRRGHQPGKAGWSVYLAGRASLPWRRHEGGDRPGKHGFREDLDLPVIRLAPFGLLARRTHRPSRYCERRQSRCRRGMVHPPETAAREPANRHGSVDRRRELYVRQIRRRLPFAASRAGRRVTCGFHHRRRL